jgi:hypothetical protein
MRTHRNIRLAWLAVLFGGLVGFGFSLLMSNYTFTGWSTRNWSKTAGVLSSVDEVSEPDANGLKVSYSYSVDGQEFEGRRIGYRLLSKLDYRALAPRQGKVIEVFYDSSWPERAVLEQGIDAGTVVLMAIPLLALGASVVVGFLLKFSGNMKDSVITGGIDCDQ